MSVEKKITQEQDYKIIFERFHEYDKIQFD